MEGSGGTAGKPSGGKGNFGGDGREGNWGSPGTTGSGSAMDGTGGKLQLLISSPSRNLYSCQEPISDPEGWAVLWARPPTDAHVRRRD